MVLVATDVAAFSVSQVVYMIRNDGCVTADEIQESIWSLNNNENKTMPTFRSAQADKIRFVFVYAPLDFTADVPFLLVDY